MDRNAQHHRERLNDAIRDEISAILEGELADPRIGLATVSNVELSADGRSAHILIEATGDEQDAEQSLEGLAAAKGFIRHELAERLHLRHAPELIFRLDKSQQYGARIDELLKRINQRK